MTSLEKAGADEGQATGPVPGVCDAVVVGAGFAAFPMPRSSGYPFDPPPALRELQGEADLVRVRIWNGSTPWLVTGYELHRRLLSDPRVSADNDIKGFPFNSETTQFRRARQKSFVQMDNPEHNYYRRMITSQFTIKAIEARRPAIQQIVDSHIDRMLRKRAPADLVRDFALPIPSLVICDMLGVPYESHDLFQSASATLLRTTTTPEQTAAAIDELRTLIARTVEQRRQCPGDDIIGHLVSKHLDRGDLTHDEITNNAMMLLIAGHETTANQIALGTLALLRNPGQLALFRGFTEPAQIAAAVEELLRYVSVIQSGRRRIALADIDIGGTTIRKGEGIIFPDLAGNWDPRVFDRPGDLILSRGTRHHVAFGYGTHQCLGQPLARVELQIACKTLFDRIPALRLAVDPSELSFRHDMNIYGVYEMPVEW
jgi:cytochrome P450